MKKIYAIVSPAYTKSSDDFTVTSYLISSYHALTFEQVCGYSLGHDVVFLETLEDAKKILEDGIKGNKLEAKTAVQKAIIELEADDEGKMTGFGKMYTLNFDKRFEPAEAPFFKAVRIPKWSEGPIAKKDISAGALDEMHMQYELSKKINVEQHAAV
ncbi:hypothetical protein OQJ15_08105 [Fluoribacter dumoffii]|uniref:hypothetical protein n=1 Tax=Fluoribacter dumoffii TaxID=463 RepID=UPI00026C7B3E|nr:hypothetical protein [Fluoribacter dumoffii]MCW8386266.1 hypothetical protein [Fluoribacter dumoffii]MCW8498461.1 hypothetical protein [Fluoribacter dumoffii]